MKDHIHIMAYMQRSEGNLQKLLLDFTGFEDQTQVDQLVSKGLYPLSHLANARKNSFKQIFKNLI